MDEMERRTFMQGVGAVFVIAAAGPSAAAKPKITLSLGAFPEVSGRLTVAVIYKTTGADPDINDLVPNDGSIIWERHVESMGNDWFRVSFTYIDYRGKEIIFNAPEADTSVPPYGVQIEQGPLPTSYIATTSGSVLHHSGGTGTNLILHSQDFTSEGWMK